LLELARSTCLERLIFMTNPTPYYICYKDQKDPRVDVYAPQLKQISSSS